MALTLDAGGFETQVVDGNLAVLPGTFESFRFEAAVAPAGYGGSTRIFLRSNTLGQYGYDFVIGGCNLDRLCFALYKLTPSYTKEIAKPADKEGWTHGSWTTVRVDLVGNRIAVFFDGELIAEYEDTDNPIASGSLVLQGRFDDVKLTGLGASL